MSDGWSRHVCAVVAASAAAILMLAVLPPLLMRQGYGGAAEVLYRAPGGCHRLAFRSWFLFGEQIAYPAHRLPAVGPASYEDATGLDPSDLAAAAAFTGTPRLGYKLGICQRDVAIALGALVVAVGALVLRRRLPPLSIAAWLLVGVAPMGVDVFAASLEAAPLFLDDLGDATPVTRTVTGLAFGAATGWLSVSQRRRRAGSGTIAARRRTRRRQRRRAAELSAAPRAPHVPAN